MNRYSTIRRREEMVNVDVARNDWQRNPIDNNILSQRQDVFNSSVRPIIQPSLVHRLHS